MRQLPMKSRILRRSLLQALLWSVLLGAVPSLAAQDIHSLAATATQRVDAAVQEGDLSLEQAVMLKADIIYNPRMLPESSPFRVKQGDRRPQRLDFLEFYEDIYRAYDELGKDELAYLSALHPDLKKVLHRVASGQPPYKRSLRPLPPSAFNRVSKAVALGKLDLKEAVLLKAQMLYAPQRLVPKPEFQPRTGEALVSEPCLTGFYEDVHKVFHQLTPEEIGLLKSLHSTLSHLLQVLEWEAGRSEAPPSALPHPDWDN
jgi:hypothetical protein